MNFSNFKKQHSVIGHKLDPTSAFLCACSNGVLELAKSLIENFPDIDVHAAIEVDFFKESAFRIACTNGHIEVAKWLKSTWPSINYREGKDYVIYFSNEDEVSKWLISLYNIENIDAVINIYFRLDKIDYINYIIAEFDIVNLSVKQEFQSKFNDMILEYHSNFNKMKSARK